MKKSVRWPEIEPGSTAWKATMLTITPPSHNIKYVNLNVLAYSLDSNRTSYSRIAFVLCTEESERNLSLLTNNKPFTIKKTFFLTQQNISWFKRSLF